MAEADPGITEEDVLALHEDILEQDEEGVRELLHDFAEDGGLVVELILREVGLEPLADDHELNKVPLTAIHRAALVGSTSIISVLLSQDGLIDRDVKLRCNGFTALHVAAAAGVTSAASYLAANGSCLEARDAEGRTPMHLCAKGGHIDVAKILSVKGASVTVQDKNCCTPLHFAAEQGHVKCISFLIQKGAALDAKDVTGRAPLHFAQRRCRKDASEILLLNGADVHLQDNDGNSALHVAAQVRLPDKNSPNTPSIGQEKTIEKNGSVSSESVEDAIDVLLRYVDKIDLTDNDGRSALHLASIADNTDVVSKLLEKGANVDAQDNVGNTALHHCRSEECLVALLTFGADVTLQNAVGDYACHVYARTDDVHPKMLNILLQNGASHNCVNELKQVPLFGACASGNVTKISYLLNVGASVECVDASGRTVLHVAVQQSHSDAVKHLLQCPNLPLNHQDRTDSSALHVAASVRNADILERLINSGCELECLDTNGRTPATVALNAENMAGLKILLSRGGNLRGKRAKDSSALLFFAKNDFNMVELLLAQGLDPNSCSEQGLSPLHVSLQSQSWDIANLLISRTRIQEIVDVDQRNVLHFACIHGAPVELVSSIVDLCPRLINVSDSSGKTSLHYCMEDPNADSLEILEHFLSHGCNFNTQDKLNKSTPLHLCSMLLSSSNTILVKSATLKLETALGDSHGSLTDPNLKDSCGKTILHYACCGAMDDVGLVRLIIGRGSQTDIQDCTGATPLHYASGEGHSKLVDFLIDRGSKLDVCDQGDRSSLHLAVQAGHCDVTDSLLANGADINLQRNDGQTALHIALQQGDVEIVEMLLMNDPDVDLEDAEGRRPIHLASAYSDKHVLQAVLGQNPNVNAVDAQGQTALHYSTRNKDGAIGKHLVTSGLGVNVTDKDRDTALHLAASLGSYDHVDTLVTLGSDVNARNKKGKSPLHLATTLSESDILEYLIANEADVDVIDSDSRTPLMLAVMNHNIDAAVMLLNHGADVTITDCDDENVLHKCARASHAIKPSFMQNIVQKGVSPYQRNKMKESAYDIVMRGSKEKIDVLLHALGINE